MRQLLSILPPRMVSRKWTSQLSSGQTLPERRGDAALGHHRVGLAEEGLAHQRRAGAHLARLDGGPEPRATGTDDDDVEVVPLGIGHQKILGSLKAPDDTR